MDTKGMEGGLVFPSRLEKGGKNGEGGGMERIKANHSPWGRGLLKKGPFQECRSE